MRSKLLTGIILVAAAIMGVMAAVQPAFADDCWDCLNACDAMYDAAIWDCENSGGPCGPGGNPSECSQCRFDAFQLWFDCLDFCLEIICAV